MAFKQYFAGLLSAAVKARAFVGQPEERLPVVVVRLGERVLRGEAGADAAVKEQKPPPWKYMTMGCFLAGDHGGGREVQSGGEAGEWIDGYVVVGDAGVGVNTGGDRFCVEEALHAAVADEGQDLNLYFFDEAGRGGCGGDERAVNDRSTGSLASPSPNSDDADEVVVDSGEQSLSLVDTLIRSGSIDLVAVDCETLNGLIGTRPTSLHDRARDSKDEESRDRDYDVAALASNLSQEFRYSIYGNDDIEDAHGSLERDDEDVYFDDESAEVVISSLRLGDDQDSSSLFTNSNWFAFEDERAVNDRSTGSLASPSPNSDDADEVVVGESEDLADKMASLQFSGSKCDDTQEMNSICLGNGPVNEPNETSGNLSPSECEKPLEWVEWRETVDLINENGANTASSAPNGDFEIEAFDSKHDNGWASDKTDNQEFNCDSPQSNDVISSASQSVSPLVVNNIPSMVPMESGHEKLVKNKDE
ncbi:hypothetical protein HPP92_009386 [Vanilla planifolia]|uniref:Uncharacterized protein n=1 Tax=Vanilla planifolia TaxID=51239 RepID=A0A835RG36_VANPL|nr:hypothetical protein HPP92_009386 [Vanilla planifolia]